MDKILTLLVLAIFFWEILLFGEVIYLKSGKKIEADIVQKTDETIKLDINGIQVTYYLDEISTIDGKKVLVPKEVKTHPKNTKDDIPQELKEEFAERCTIRIEKGKEYLNQAHYFEALREFQEAVKLDPERPAAYVGLATAYAFTAQFEKARETFRKARKMYEIRGEQDKVKQIDAAIINIPHKAELAK